MLCNERNHTAIIVKYNEVRVIKKKERMGNEKKKGRRKETKTSILNKRTNKKEYKEVERSCDYSISLISSRKLLSKA